MADLKKAVNAPERLIDENELMEWLKGKIRECVVLNAHAEAATTEEIIRYVKHMPAVDAAPVVHGRWEEKMEHAGYACCSVCHDCYVEKKWIFNKKWAWCPQCGARMDGGDDDA